MLVCVTVIVPEEQLQLIAYAVAELRTAIEVTTLSKIFFIICPYIKIRQNALAMSIYVKLFDSAIVKFNIFAKLSLGLKMLCMNNSGITNLATRLEVFSIPHVNRETLN